MKAPRLRTRLLTSYVVVIAVGGAVTYLIVRLLAPRLFDERMHLGPGSGQGMGAGLGPGPSARDAVRSAVNVALLVGLGASILVAGVLALWAGQRLVQPLTALRRATRRVAAGDYAVEVPAPHVPELAELAEDVRTLATALAETETRRTRLLGDVAHEMRTPLTALDGYVEGLVDGVFTADERTLAALTDELRRLHRLADDLAQLSRAEEQRLDLRPAPADLTALGKHAVERLRSQFDDAGVRLVLDAGAPVPVVVDPARIEQVLTNLLGNALAATPAGGTVAVAVAVGADGSTATVTVSDTGIGIPADDLERIFERFYRARPDRGPGGSGIGLTIARSIARGHGGDLVATSPGPGQGARFTLTLPAG